MSQTRKLYAVIGDPVGHSLSPDMHNAAFAKLAIPAEYIAVRVAKEDLAEFTRSARKNLAGFNITVPHKNAIIPLLDEISDMARLCGSVNTVTVGEDGKLKGETTDGYGFEKALEEAFSFNIQGSDLLFIGCGGVVNALAFHAAMKKAHSIKIINRTIEKADSLAQKIHDAFPETNIETAASADCEKCAAFIKDSRLAVQCTSLGLKQDDPAPVNPDIFNSDILYFDTIYKETSLLKALRERGNRAVGGAAMLLYQGAKAFEIWTGKAAPIEDMRATLP